MLVLERPGIVQKDLALGLNLKPSMVTRMVDALEARGLVSRRSEACAALIFSTPRGQGLGPEMEACWKRLHERYTTVVGREEGDTLGQRLFEAATGSKGSEVFRNGSVLSFPGVASCLASRCFLYTMRLDKFFACFFLRWA